MADAMSRSDPDPCDLRLHGCIVERSFRVSVDVARISGSRPGDHL
jgi:hypothetical protein